MAQRSHVPKFGNWDSEDNVPYTAYFDKARKGKTNGKMINPNDPQENPEMFPDIAKQAPTSASGPKAHNEPEEPLRRRAVQPTHDHGGSKEEYDLKQFNDYPAPNENIGRRNSGGSAHQRGGHMAGSNRPVRSSIGSENSFDRSPLHPHYQAKVTGKGGANASPAWEGKHSSDSSHGTPGRSKMKPTRVEDSPDRGAAVPRFGEWDQNPSSADNYTHIFNKVREERITGSPMASGPESRPNYNVPRNQKDKKGCCFPWFK